MFNSASSKKAGTATLVAGICVSALIASSSPARAGAFDSIKRAAMTELKKEVKRQVQAAVPSISETVTTKDLDNGVSLNADDDVSDFDSNAIDPDEDSQSGTVEDSEISSSDVENQMMVMLIPTDQKEKAAIQPRSLSLNFTKITYATMSASVGDVNGDGAADLILDSEVCSPDVPTGDADITLTGMTPMRKAYWARVLDNYDLKETCKLVRKIVNGSDIEASAKTSGGGDNRKLPMMLLPAIQKVRSASNSPQPAIFIKYEGIKGSA